MVFVIATQKGGVGKTTTAAAIAQAAAAEGRTALAIDLDPQQNLTFTLAADPASPGSYDLLEGASPADVIQGTEQGIDVIAASPDLAAVQTGRGSARRLQEALKPIRNLYDIVIIDVPVTPELQYNGIQAADVLIIPIHADVYGTHSLDYIIDTAMQIRQSNPAMKIGGIILTCYDKKTNYGRAMREAVEQKAKAAGIPFLGAVRKGVAIQEAQGFQQSLYKYAPKSHPARDYMEIFKMLTKLEV